MKKKKILVMSDSPKLHTGFGRVGKEVWTRLNRTGKYDITAIGWFHQDTNEDATYPIVTTKKDTKGRLTQKDKYAHESFSGYVDKYKPDIVWTLGDSLAENRVIPVKIDGEIDLLKFEELWNYIYEKGTKEEQVGEDGMAREFINTKDLDIYTLTHLGWKKINVISRHLFSGNLAYIEQPKGHTMCTFNHSVMINDGKSTRKAIPEETLKHELCNLETLEDDITGKYSEDRDIILARICGAYVSEGSLTDTKCGKRTRISSTKIDWLRSLQDDFDYIFNKRGSIESNIIKNGNCYKSYSLVIYGQDIFNWFLRNCGRYSEGKKVPKFVINGNKDVINEFLLKAHEGDGYSGTEISYTTKSIKLASGISFLHKMLGEKVSIRYRDEKEAYTIRRIYKERLVRDGVYRIENVLYDGYVYDLTVEEAHTFVDALGCVICFNTWMTDHVAKAPNRNTFKWIGYFPIDGMPSPSKWKGPIEDMDVAVAYGGWGAKVIKQKAPKANIKHIYHGVDTDIFKPKKSHNKFADKRGLLGIKGDKKIIGIVSRNQPRKAFDKLFEAYFYLLNGEYCVCDDCHNFTRRPFHLIDKTFSDVGECKHCKSKNIKKGSPRDDIRLYVHAAPVDCGWDLLDLQKDFNLSGKVLINPQLKIGVGVAEMTLNSIYNCMDVFTLPTRGEGFGLPVLEAMSCGIPIVATDYSAYTEWAGVGGILVPPSDFEAEPLTNIRRALIDVDLYITALAKILDNPKLASEYGEAGRKRALEMDWKNIVTQWEELVDSILFPEGAPEKIEASDLEYNLEEM